MESGVLYVRNLTNTDWVAAIGGVGAQGAQGNQGPSGSPGTPGGPQGYQGYQGATGIGVQGLRGFQGYQGYQGYQGRTGSVGAQGPTGAMGYQGYQGHSGVGVQGPQGYQGRTGTPGFQGYQGYQGTTGAGYQGYQGDQGFQGYQGYQGTTGVGVQGYQGVTGTPGAQGYQGASGSPGTPGGPQGYQGDQGYQGVPGTGSGGGHVIEDEGTPLTQRPNLDFQGQNVWVFDDGVDTTQVIISGGGSTGPQGYQGPTGAQGYQGYQGHTGMGFQGYQGSTGAQGTQGYQGHTGIGFQGYQGATGAQGTQGYQGVTGGAGAQGYQGATGAQGYQGVTGAQGYQGVTGAQGFQGYQGYQGHTGVGFQGYQGPTGTPGTQGYQGYQGHTGAGVQGYQGATGAQGTQGYQGYQGHTGAGVQGPQGYQGNQGLAGTGSAHVIRDETTPLTQRSFLSFKGENIWAVDNAGADSTDIIVSGSASVPPLISGTPNFIARFNGSGNELESFVRTSGSDIHFSNGRIYFGTGSDVDLYRYQDNMLMTDDDLFVLGYIMTTDNIYICHIGDKLLFGDSSGTYDVNIYRTSDGHLITDNRMAGQPAINSDEFMTLGQYTGSAGPQGYQGATGSKGATGSQGPQGYQGHTGVGVQGYQGATGAQGFQGYQGYTGSPGPQGYQGYTGAQGYQGYQGHTGSPGPQGYQGSTGSQGSPGATAGQTYWFHNTGTIAGFEGLYSYPADGVEIDEAITTTGSAGTECLVDKYMTAPGVPGITQFPVGLWRFHCYHYVNLGGANDYAVYRVYKRTTGGVETELFNVTSSEIDATSSQEYITDYTVTSGTAMNDSDRVVVKIFVKSSIPGRIIHFLYEGNTSVSYITTPLGSTPGPQGYQGATGSQGPQGYQGEPGGGLISGSAFIGAKYNTNSTQSIPSNTGTIINYGNKVYDTNNAVTTGTNWYFKAPSTGYYLINASVALSGSNQWGNSEYLQLYCLDNVEDTEVGDVLYHDEWVVGMAITNPLRLGAGSVTKYLSSGTSLSVYVKQTAGATLILYPDSGYNYVAISKLDGIQGPSGTPGAQGYQGHTGMGYQGYQGHTGAQGFQGYQGYQGHTGMGYQGYQGYQGAGYEATSNSSGTIGIGSVTRFQLNQTGTAYSFGARIRVSPILGDSTTSMDGTISAVSGTIIWFYSLISNGSGTYASWNINITGEQGWQGRSGTQGSQGYQGYQGETGSQGFQGYQGYQGHTGMGYQGYQGVTGAQGAQGYQGYQGHTGMGYQGYQGYQGPSGSPGSGGGTLVTGTPFYVPRFSSSGTNVMDSAIYNSGSMIGIGTNSPEARFHLVPTGTWTTETPFLITEPNDDLYWISMNTNNLYFHRSGGFSYIRNAYPEGSIAIIVNSGSNTFRFWENGSLGIHAGTEPDDNVSLYAGKDITTEETLRVGSGMFIGNEGALWYIYQSPNNLYFHRSGSFSYIGNFYPRGGLGFLVNSGSLVLGLHGTNENVRIGASYTAPNANIGLQVEKDIVTNASLIIGSGLYVGSTAGSPSVDDIIADGQVFAGTSMGVGFVTGSPSSGDIHIKTDARVGGGVVVGTTTEDPGVGVLGVYGTSRLYGTVRIGTGLYVGSTSADAGNDDIIADGQIFAGTSMGVGFITGSPPAGDLIAKNDIRVGGGLSIGTTITGAAGGNLIMPITSSSIYLGPTGIFEDYFGYCFRMNRVGLIIDGGGLQVTEGGYFGAVGFTEAPAGSVYGRNQFWAHSGMTIGYLTMPPSFTAPSDGGIYSIWNERLTAARTDGYSAGIDIHPYYTGGFVLTRHNYINLRNMTLQGTTGTDAPVFRFDAAAATHKSLTTGTTKTSPGTVSAWVKININGTIYYIPAYTSRTS